MGKIVLKNIDFSLTPESIQRAIDEVRKLKEDLADALSELARILTSQGAEIASMYVVQMNAVWTGMLAESGIQWKYDENAHEGYVYSDLDYAVLVEYGTGFVGENEPHPGLSDSDWNNPGGVSIGNGLYTDYDTNGHGEAGWWYPAEWGWWIPKEGPHAGEKMAWTQGMPSRPFMYRTFSDLIDEAETRGGTFIAQYIP